MTQLLKNCNNAKQSEKDLVLRLLLAESIQIYPDDLLSKRTSEYTENRSGSVFSRLILPFLPDFVSGL